VKKDDKQEDKPKTKSFSKPEEAKKEEIKKDDKPLMPSAKPS